MASATSVLHSDKTSTLWIVMFITALLLISVPVIGQSTYWVGLEPSVVIEPDYEDGEIDLGLLQLVVRGDLKGNLDWRCLLLNNYHVGGVSGFNDLGIEMAAPYYLSSNEPGTGWYIAPVVSAVYNLRLEQDKMTTAMEVGNSITISDKVGLNVGLQLGRTRFPGGDWRSHFGVKVQVGRWLHLD